MELFTLGADNGYTETDVREQARALTGWRADWDEELGPVNFRFDPSYHDKGVKKIFGHSGHFDWQDSLPAVPRAPGPPRLLRRQALVVLRADAGTGEDASGAQAHVSGKKGAVRPLVEAILMHPELYSGPRMVKPPIVQIAGLMRGRRTGIRRRL